MQKAKTGSVVNAQLSTNNGMLIYIPSGKKISSLDIIKK